MIYVKKIDLQNETHEVLGIYDDTDEEKATKLCVDLKLADDNNPECTWVFSMEPIPEASFSFSAYRRQIFDQLLEEGEFTQELYDFFEKRDFKI